MAQRLRMGELLLSRRICTREQLRHAWEQKILFGDRLGTNLLALGYIDEETLSKALGAQLVVHAGHGSVIRVEAAALKLVSKTLAEKRGVVPHHVVERTLFLLMRDPHDAHAIDEAQFSSGLHVVPVVVCEARMWQLLETHYKVRVSSRPIVLDRKHPPPLPHEISAPRRIKALGPELTNEEDFERLYAGMHTVPNTDAVKPDDVDDISALFGGPQDAYTTQPNPVMASDILQPPKSGLDEGTAGWRETIERTNPSWDRAELGLPPAAPDEAAAAGGSQLEPFPERQPTLSFAVDASAVQEDNALTFAEATRLVSSAADRDAIARLVLRAARSRFARACLLTVFPDRFVGWLGVGEGMEHERIKDIVVPRFDRSVFGLVAETRSHYIGPLQRWPLHGPWVKATGKKIPASLAVVPILVRGRAVNLFVCDNGHGSHIDPDLSDVLILTQQIAGAYEGLIGG